MDLQIVLGYALAMLIGITLGLVGSGGSILTVPILVYLMAIDAVTATGYSLFVVGVTAMVGAGRSIAQGNAELSIAAIFGLPSMVAAFATRSFLLPMVPELFQVAGIEVEKSKALLILFAAIMLMAAYKMIMPAQPKALFDADSSVKLLLSGTLIGIVAGAAGAGGGFLIIPALVFLAGLPMIKAVGTSLVIIAVQSLAGFAGDIGPQTDWGFLLLFTSIAVVGIFVGIALSKKIRGESLKTGFGYFILAMGIFIVFKELAG